MNLAVGMGTQVRSLVVASDACLWYVGSVLLVCGLGDASYVSDCV